MLHSEKYLNKTLSLATAEYQIGDIPKLFTEATLNPVKYKRIPKIIVRLVMGKKLYKMFDYMNQNDFCVVPDIQKIREAFSIESDFKDWVNLNFKPE